MKLLSCILCFVAFTASAQDSSRAVIIKAKPFIELGVGYVINSSGPFARESYVEAHDILLGAFFNQGIKSFVHFGVPFMHCFGISARISHQIFFSQTKSISQYYKQLYPGTDLSIISRPWNILGFEMGAYGAWRVRKLEFSLEALIGKSTIYVPWLSVIGNKTQNEYNLYFARQAAKIDITTFSPSMRLARYNNNRYYFISTELYINPFDYKYYSLDIQSYPENRDTERYYPDVLFPTLTVGYGWQF